MTELSLSVIICTHNPRKDYLTRVLNALGAQTLDSQKWELIIVDNASTHPISEEIEPLEMSLNSINLRVVVETTLGLSAARLRGHQEAQGNWLVYVDDDNVLDSDYLQSVYTITSSRKDLGVFSGKAIPEFEKEPEGWISDFHQVLALRDLGDRVLLCQRKTEDEPNYYPEFAPAGAGMVVNRDAFQIYVDKAAHDAQSMSLGRRGKSLTSGEDNDIVLTIFNSGWGVGYFPELKLIHLISENRLERQYMARLNRAASRSWVQVLDMHGIRHWSKIPPWTIVPRQIKAFLTHQAWRSPEDYIRWCGSCGQIEARGALS